MLINRIILVALPLTALAGCKGDVPKEKMDLAAEWSKKACKCKDKGDFDEAWSCYEKLKKPDPGDRDAVTAKSLAAFEDLLAPGLACSTDIARTKKGGKSKKSDDE